MHVPNRRARALVTVAIISVLTLTAACVDSDGPTPAPSVVPSIAPSVTPTPTAFPVPTTGPNSTAVSPTATPVPRKWVSKEQVIAAAENALLRDSDSVTAVKDMRDMVTRLIRAKELHSPVDIASTAMEPDDLVWVVQVEGTSRVPGDSAEVEVEPVKKREFRFNAVVVDPVTGHVIERLYTVSEPIILPSYYRSDHTEYGTLPVDYTEAPFDSVQMTPEEAIDAVIKSLEDRGLQLMLEFMDLEAIEYELVRLFPKYPPPMQFLYPTSSPVYLTPTPYPPSAVYPMAWDIVLAEKFSLADCEGVSFPPPIGPFHVHCWPFVETYRVDMSTGEVTKVGAHTGIGPNMPVEDYEVIDSYAETFGLWAVWHVLKDVGGQYRFDNFMVEDFVAAFDSSTFVAANLEAQ